MRPAEPAGGPHLACPPAQVDARLAYRILRAGLVPVNDLGTQAYGYYCRLGGMVSRFVFLSLTVVTRFRERKEEKKK